jgi:hypothetical protein
MDSQDERQGKEWDALYEELGVLLERYGKEDARGEGDFWIVDDNWGSVQHKVCVTRLAFLTQPLALDIQRLLQNYSLDWGVLLSLDKPGLRPDPNDVGVAVTKSNIEELWNVARMERVHGSEFRWGRLAS